VSRVVLVVGEPGAGKTTLVREYMDHHPAVGSWRGPHRYGLVRYHDDGHLRFVVGVYAPGEVFAGTDRLSMAVQPEFLAWMSEPWAMCPATTVTLEGDRLGSVCVVDGLLSMGHDVRVVHLTCAAGEQQRRLLERGSDQSPAFLKGRRTKVQRVADHAARLGRCRTFASDVPSDWRRALDYLDGAP